MKSLSCQTGMPECADAFRLRRDRKNEVDMMSKASPCLRQAAMPFRMFGVSM